MPLLQFDTSPSLSVDEKTALADRMTEIYITEMETTAEHVAVIIQEREPSDSHLGRAVDGPILFLNAEIRCGQSVDRKRTFALKTFAYVGETFDVPDENMKVLFTEHPGKSVMGSTASGESDQRIEQPSGRA